MAIAAHVANATAVENEAMKLTKETLKRIIKEELTAALQEEGEQMSIEKGIAKSATGDAHPFAYAALMAKKQGGDGKEITKAIIKGLEEQGIDWKSVFKAKHPNRGMKESGQQ